MNGRMRGPECDKCLISKMCMRLQTICFPHSVTKGYKSYETYATQKVNSPLRSGHLPEQDRLEKHVHALPKSRASSLPTMIFITSYPTFIWHSTGDEDSCT